MHWTRGRVDDGGPEGGSVRDRSESEGGDPRMHRSISRIRWLALSAVLALAGAACGSSGTTTPPGGGSTGGIVKGGTIEIGMTSDFHEALDPSREYYTI